MRLRNYNRRRPIIRKKPTIKFNIETNKYVLSHSALKTAKLEITENYHTITREKLYERQKYPKNLIGYGCPLCCLPEYIHLFNNRNSTSAGIFHIFNVLLCNNCAENLMILPSGDMYDKMVRLVALNDYINTDRLKEVFYLSYT